MIVDIQMIAKLTHQLNREYCYLLGDYSQVDWDDAPEWQKESAMNGVEFLLDGSGSPQQSHENWMDQKLKDGWKYGPVKDADKKEHPCLVGYHQLPIEQQMKDHLFSAVVKAFLYAQPNGIKIMGRPK